MFVSAGAVLAALVAVVLLLAGRSRRAEVHALTELLSLREGMTSIGFDSALKLSSCNSTSYVEKPHGKLPDGTTFPQQVLLDGKAKQIQGKVTNSGHKKGA